MLDALERIWMFFLENPRRLTALGKILLETGGALLIAGSIGHLICASYGIEASLTHKAPTPVSLADVYPDLPLWWVPESAFGYILSCIITVAGVYFVRTGKRLTKILNRW